MELQDVINDSKSFQRFHENAVQDILNESVAVEISQSLEAPESISRLISPILGNVSELTENLILTSASCVNPNTIETLGISCVISCAPELPDTPLAGGIVYHRVQINDCGSCRVYNYFDQTADLIQKMIKSGRRVLVYCVAGVSRSATICIAYLIKHHSYSLLDAYNFVKSRRPRIKPNCGFFEQLIEYEKQLHGTSSVSTIFNEFVQMNIPNVYDKDYRMPNNTYTKKRESANWRR